MACHIEEQCDGTGWVEIDEMGRCKGMKGFDMFHPFGRHGLIYSHLLDPRISSLDHVEWPKMLLDVG